MRRTIHLLSVVSLYSYHGSVRSLQIVKPFHSATQHGCNRIKPATIATALGHRHLKFAQTDVPDYHRSTKIDIGRVSDLYRSSALSMGQPSETDPLISRKVEDNDEDVKAAPSRTTGQKILDLAVPAAAALLIDPLMTLADTAFVGRFNGESAAPLAGMGSAAALLTFSFYLFNFLCTATTPLVARQRASGNEQQAAMIGGQVLSLALLLGIVLTMLLLLFKQPLLRIMGTGFSGDEANGYALAFLSVRALAAPAVFCIEASTGVLRGYLDTKTPIVVLVIANIINLLLDVVLIAFLRLGPMGAAIATTTAEWISAGLFLAVLAGQVPSAGKLLERTSPKEKRSSTTGPGTATNASATYPTMTIVPALAIPSWEDIQPLFVASSSVFFRAVVLQASLSAAAAMAARSGASTVELVDGMTTATAAASIAAHQIGIQLWLLCSFFCDSLAAASQGLIADAIGRNDADGVVDISRTIFTYSLILGLLLAFILQVGSAMNWLQDLFTQEPSIRFALGRILPLIVVAQPLNALVFAADGVIQGAAEFPFQAKAMALSGLTAVATFVALEAFGSDIDTLVHVWSALIVLQLMRGLTSLWKLLDKNGPINLLSSKPTL